MEKPRGLLGAGQSLAGGRFEFDVSIVLPFRKAERTIGGTLEHIAIWAGRSPWRTEVVAVDDGSADATEAAAARWRSYFDGYQLVLHEVKRGMGAAARSGVLAARGRYVIVADPRVGLPIENAKLLIDNLAAGCDVAAVSRRAVDKQAPGERSFLERAAETTFMAFSQLVVRTGVRDSLCGLTGYRRRAARRIAERSRVQGAAFAIEWLALAEWFGFHVQECPARWVRPGARATTLSPVNAPGILRDLWRTRRRLAADMYSGPVPAKELLHETSFVKLDRVARPAGPLPSRRSSPGPSRARSRGSIRLPG